MSSHLCLKWNNHCSAFIKSISNIQVKERYCDATIACQGKYFPVHRIILSTCSEYFDEIFERMQCPHPYVVFKDIEPREMELLLNYMYQGEVNVTQEMLPSLIKAAEALKIKGLAVPDEIPPVNSPPRKRRCNTSSDNQHAKKRSSEPRERNMTTDTQREVTTEKQPSNSSDVNLRLNPDTLFENEEPFRVIKEEPLDAIEFVDALSQETKYEKRDSANDSSPNPTEAQIEEEDVLANIPSTDETVYMNSEEVLNPSKHYNDQSSSWSEFGRGATAHLSNLLPPEMNLQGN
ncbi:UNVERIFIED_CONTAM: hypothetical protein GTU68_037048, partial [Idotea baltica]|nr:hypothetical protein [Idotea baltica]